jgi:hypothetical protein
MRRKVSTLLDESLFRRAKLESVRQGKQISEIVGEALEGYLGEKSGKEGSLGVVAESWGVLALPRARVKKVLAEEKDLLEA